MRRFLIFVIAAGCVAFSMSETAVAQVGVAEARGQVKDDEGNPIKGAVVTFRNTASEQGVYTDTTNKKGRYFLTGLLYFEGGKWVATAEHEGYVTTHMKVESRSQSRVDAKFELPLKRGQQPPEIRVAAFGEVTVDFELTPEDELAPIAPPVAGAGADVPLEALEEADVPATQKEDAYAAAFRLASAGKLQESLPKFEEAIADSPDDAALLEANANVLYRLKQYEAAAIRARKASEAAPDKAEPVKILYAVEVARENWSGAADALDTLASIDPDDPWVPEQQAYLADQQGDVEAAIAAYRKLTEIDPTNAAAWASLGGLYARKGDLEASNAAYEKVVELDPKGAYKTFYNIGALIENKGDISDADNRKAIAAYRKAIEIKDDYAPAYKKLAFALLRDGDPEGAREALEGYLEVDPRAGDAAQVKAMIQSLSKGS